MSKLNLNISRQVFNPVYLPYLESHNRFEVYWGGAGSGKSVFVAQKKIYKGLRQKMNLLVVRQTGDTNRDSTFALFKQIISKWNLRTYFKIRESDMRITFPNGNQIIFKGLDDAEKLKSMTFENGELTDIWIEEASEILEEDYNQLNIRLRGGNQRKNTTVSFNPVDINHWLKKRLFDNPPDDCITLHSTYKDNKFLQDEDRQLMESFKGTDPYYYTVYCLGQWGTLGKTIFDAQKVSERIACIADIKPVKVGYFDHEYDGDKVNDESIKWVDDPTGYIKIYSDVLKGYPYVIGGDTAGEGSDFFVCQVINNITGQQAAVLRQQFDEDLYSKQAYCLGRYYNNALLGIESNYTIYPIRDLQYLGYPRQFMREVEDNITHKIVQKFGFHTNKMTRPIIISELVKLVRENTDLFYDYTTLQEMLTFVRNEKGRPEAQEGAHDDCIMALAIAYYIRTQQSFIVQEETIPMKKRLTELPGYSTLGDKKTKSIKDW
jgi:phage terminase large subunit